MCIKPKGSLANTHCVTSSGWLREDRKMVSPSSSILGIVSWPILLYDCRSSFGADDVIIFNSLLFFFFFFGLWQGISLLNHMLGLGLPTFALDLLHASVYCIKCPIIIALEETVNS